MEKKETKIGSLHQLGEDLLAVYGELRDGSIEAKTADALANVAGKVIGALKIQLEYNTFKDSIQKIDLLEDRKLKAS